MSYTAREQSETSGQPQEMFLFQVGPTNYSFTSADVELSKDGLTYTREDIEVEDIVQSVEKEQSEITISVPLTNALASIFTVMLPPFEIPVTIWRQHYADAEIIKWWSGTVVSVSTATANGQSQIKCASELSVYDRLGVRRKFQPTCNHMLYDPDTCRLNPNDYKQNAVITSINVADLQSATFASQPDGYYTAGFARRPSNGDLRLIVAHSGINISLWHPFEGLLPFETLEVFAGCDHSDLMCFSKFNNLVNNGSWPTVPLKNPAETRFA